MKSGVYDPDDRMHARIMYHGVPVKAAFPVCGGRKVQAVSFNEQNSESSKGENRRQAMDGFAENTGRNYGRENNNHA